jgi:pentose-5-phosphate-3-epimerase
MIWNIIKVSFLLSSIGIWISYLIGYLDVMQVIHFQGLLIITAAATVGLALDLDTELSKITVSLEDLDVILLMGVKAGLSGQVFNPKVLEKIKSLKEKSFVPIEVDGGVNDTNIVDLKNAGAERFVTTSFLFQDDPTRAFEKLNNLIIS